MQKKLWRDMRNISRTGFGGSIIKGTLKAPVEVEVEALRWLFKLPALADKCKAGATSIWSRGIRFRDHLHTLLRSCASLAAGLDGKVRKYRLLMCLDAIHSVARGSITPNGLTPSVDVLSINFANMGFMRMLWTDSDPAIRVTSRSTIIIARQSCVEDSGGGNFWPSCWRQPPPLTESREVTVGPPTSDTIPST
ncbi:hypothetical protein BGW80DRAFT_1458997 [Lactifluus volemus]|nr:hypothetical protein BGW80DRAFT_1458997 [Lactifluus volemus]